MCRAATAIHDKKTVGLKTRALHQGNHTFFERGIFQRLKLVEQGHDDTGGQPHDKQLVHHQHTPGDHPPPCTTGLHQIQDQPQQWQTQGSAQQNTFEHVSEPQPHGHAVKSKRLFDVKGLHI